MEFPAGETAFRFQETMSDGNTTTAPSRQPQHATSAPPSRAAPGRRSLPHQRGDSLATQRQQVEGYAMTKGWQRRCQRVRPFCPASGRQAADVIITAKLDRAFRNAADALATLPKS